VKNEKQQGDVCESKGRTVDEAVSEALLRLGARRDEVQIEVLDEGKDGHARHTGGSTGKAQNT